MRTWVCVVVAFCLFVGIQAVAQLGVFIIPPQYAVEGRPAAVAVGDFNGDGKLDLAVSNLFGWAGVVSILLGNGDGTFQTHVDYPGGNALIGTYFLPMAVGDFNGDGKLDLVVANYESGTLSVLFGNGDGTFQPHVDYGTAGGAEATSVVVGDFNGDGKPDLAVAVGGGVSVYSNSGTGTFPTRKDYDLGSGFVYLALGDFNNDGKLDLAAVIPCPPGSGSCQAGPSVGSIAILLGNGDGTFQAPVNYAVGASPVFVAVADLNGDGALDLAVANSNAVANNGVLFGSGPGSVSLLFGNGDGTFQPQQVYPAGLAPSSVVVGDFNGDSQLDFAVTNEQDETVGVYLNQGHGTFSQPTVFYGAGAQAVAAVAGDFNRDQQLDLAVAVFYEAVSVLLGKGDGSFSPTNLSYPTGSNPSAVAIADLSGDKKTDVAVANFGDNNVSVFMGNGDGTLQPRENYSTGNGPSSVAIADLNGDGKPDLVVANYTDNTVSVLLNNGNGTFQNHVDYPTAAFPYSVAVGDLNGDGKLDLAIACLGSTSGSGSVSILLGNGDGTFRGHTDYPYGYPYGSNVLTAAIALGDFNGDGKLDFAVADTVSYGDSEVDVFLSNGDGTFSSAVTELCLVCFNYFFSAIAAADFNADGKLDLAVSGPAAPSFWVLLGNGDGTFQVAPSGVGVGVGGHSMAVGDFNGDGILDVALGVSGQVLLLLGNGDGSFRIDSGKTNWAFYGTAESQYGGQVAAGDLNGDGKPDLAVANGSFPSQGVSSNTLTILLNAPPDFTISAPVSTTPSSVMPGQAGTATVTVGSTGGFTGTVAFTCSVSPTPASAPTCSLSPTQVQVKNGAQATSTLNVNTTGPTAFLTRPNLGRGLAPIYAIVFPIFGLALVGVGFTSGGRRQKVLGLVICCVLFGGLVLQMACGGGSSGSTSTPGTPAGSYTVTVTGSSGSTQHATSVTLTVQ